MKQPEQIRRKNLLAEIEQFGEDSNKVAFEKWLTNQSIEVRKFIYKELDKNTLPLPDGKTDIYDCIRNIEDHIKQYYEKTTNSN